MKSCTLPDSKLLADTRTRLRNRPITMTLETIAVNTNLPKHWLQSILTHPNMNPAVNRIECLWEYLSGKTLQL